ncbi:MAG: 3-phosphoserine/phosphohydroxythreonine transaminase, partial [Myxococcales bacterium]|nr:3-phosphoserine/phosphohydroxythreonine transaminase [Myxococcales bacterium]
MTRPVNFAPGPSILAPSVLDGLAKAVLGLDEVGGLSILEISHRSKYFDGVLAETQQRLRALLGIPDTHAVLFLQGGARGQFAQLPLNFLRPGRRAAFVDTGVWARGALDEAKLVGDAYSLASSHDGGYRHLPDLDGVAPAPDTEYVHTTSNNTIYGTQWQTLPDFGAVHHVCDMSSDVLSRPVDVSRFGVIYAGAQKNAGPAGVTLVIADRRWIAEARTDIPTIWQYGIQDKKDSCYNTPPTFAIYAVMLVCRWLEEQGGLEAIARVNEQKAQAIYEVVDGSGGFYHP